MGWRLCARAALVAVLVTGAAACLGAVPAIAADPPATFFGMQAWTVPTARDVALMKRGGVGSLRQVFDGALQAAPESVRWSAYDALMTAAARERLEVLPVLLGIPGARVRIQRPTTRAGRIAWGHFVTAVARRYGRGGTFWAAHPQLEPMPLTAYQVWNEPNLPAYWRPAGDVASYLRFVRLTRERLRAVDPQALVVLGGLPDSRLGTPMLDYVSAIYAQPGARALFDVVALHPYAARAADVLAKLNGVRATMDAHGDYRTPIWVTEIGWATGGRASPFKTTLAGQALRVAQTLRSLRAARLRLRLGRVMWFGLQDRPYVATESRWWGPRVGLFDLAGRPKPAWNAFVAITGGEPGGRLRSAVRRGPSPSA